MKVYALTSAGGELLDGDTSDHIEAALFPGGIYASADSAKAAAQEWVNELWQEQADAPGSGCSGPAPTLEWNETVIGEHDEAFTEWEAYLELFETYYRVTERPVIS